MKNNKCNAKTREGTPCKFAGTHAATDGRVYCGNHLKQLKKIGLPSGMTIAPIIPDVDKSDSFKLARQIVDICEKHNKDEAVLVVAYLLEWSYSGKYDSTPDAF